MITSSSDSVVKLTSGNDNCSQAPCDGNVGLTLAISLKLSLRFTKFV